ncbi:MAG TPA: hypothetical protein VGU63_08245 [Candidatus Acidoferrales bacterium]|nr:hypothetical protein [Candidatus Acidoferrales bacterium]
MTTALVSGCGLTGHSSPNPQPNVTVTVQPARASVQLGAMQQFTATVTGTISSAVNWSVNGVAGGNSATGTISSAGLYAAPQSLPSPSSVTVTASSQAAPSASGSASVQLQSGIVVGIAPNSANVTPGASANFTATVTGAGALSAAVSWSVNSIAGGNSSLGTITATGSGSATYTAPAMAPTPPSVIVTATSVADPSKSANASVTISCAAANAISPALASISVGASQIFSVSLCVAAGTAIAWDVNGIAGGNSSVGTIAPTAANTAAYTAPASIPSTNPVTIHAVAGSQSVSAVVTIINVVPVSVTVSPASASVAVNQRASFTATVSGASNPAVTWTVNSVANGNLSLGQICAPASNPCVPPSGNETSVDYLAPQTQPQPNTVTLTATSQAAPAKSGSAQITITPAAQPGVSIAPFYAFLSPSQPFHFIANVTGVSNTAVTWTIATAVPGQGCSGASCGSIDNAGDYIAPAVAPSPNGVSVTATSVANPSLAATATVALTSAPVIETVLPSSIDAGPQNSFLLAVQGLNFIASTSSGTSQLLINNSPRATNCPTPNRCTITLQPADVAAAGLLSVEIQNPGTPPTLSNPVPFVILPAASFPGVIALNGASTSVFGNDILVPEETTAGATTSPASVEFVGMVTPDGSTCTIQASALAVTRPASGSATVNICVQGTFLDPTFTYTFSSPQSGGDIGISTASMASLFPNLVELTLTLSNQTAPGVRSLFITTPNGDVAVATGILEVK